MKDLEMKPRRFLSNSFKGRFSPLNIISNRDSNPANIRNVVFSTEGSTIAYCVGFDKISLSLNFY